MHLSSGPLVFDIPSYFILYHFSKESEIEISKPENPDKSDKPEKKEKKRKRKKEGEGPDVKDPTLVGPEKIKKKKLKEKEKMKDKLKLKKKMGDLKGILHTKYLSPSHFDFLKTWYRTDNISF